MCTIQLKIPPSYPGHSTATTRIADILIPSQSFNFCLLRQSNLRRTISHGIVRAKTGATHQWFAPFRVTKARTLLLGIGGRRAEKDMHGFHITGGGESNPVHGDNILFTRPALGTTISELEDGFLASSQKCLPDLYPNKHENWCSKKMKQMSRCNFKTLARKKIERCNLTASTKNVVLIQLHLTIQNWGIEPHKSAMSSVTPSPDG
ncbi:hypothetical protein EV421DRAFT_1748716 [Armillaria borealis]|uniref:Uncharacterized protein n=1 Tax=Armillaria borealis TaxID=47425 RepID=A0AA39IBL0_9AGAR|nr:hypothetical protein EV421DRAFT_1748716 [Armillaria borealis]